MSRVLEKAKGKWCFDKESTEHHQHDAQVELHNSFLPASDWGLGDQEWITLFGWKYPNMVRKYPKYPNKAKKISKIPKHDKKYPKYPDMGEKYPIYPNMMKKYPKYPNMVECLIISTFNIIRLWLFCSQCSLMRIFRSNCCPVSTIDR